jgi:DNA-binding CsgD family transcriptional regulator
MVHRQITYGISDEDSRIYLNHYAAIDPRLEYLAVRRAQWFSDYETFDDTLRTTHPFYTEYFRPRGAGESLFSLFAIEGPRIATLGLVRELRQPKADAMLRAKLDRLITHLDRAFRITRRFASLAAEVSIARTVMDTLGEPICCVDESGFLRRVNLAFEACLKNGDIVASKFGKLQFPSPRDQTQVMRAVRECVGLARALYSRDSEAKLTFPIRKKDGRTAFVTVAPLVAGSAQSWAGSPCALVRIDEFNADPDPERIEHALGLTAAEARLVAMLCRGGSLAAAASEAGISLNTAKTQLAAVFSKTDTKRQSELIALISALPR